jgi:3',5'-cyclic-AMP phosphodiesterase
MNYRVSAVWLLVLLACCLLPADERVDLDRKVGRHAESGWSVTVRDRLASVRTVAPDRIELWAQAPVLAIELEHVGEPAPVTLDVFNCARLSKLTFSGGTLDGSPIDGRAATCRFVLPTLSRESVRVGPLDADTREPFEFAVLSDVQRAIGEVHEIFERMNEDPSLRFVVSTGDLVNLGERDELLHFQRELAALQIPLYSTVGNHEMGADPRHWHELFGPFNVHFAFKGVTFSLLDSGNATIDPTVYDWLDAWLALAKDDVHVLLTHVPPIDPVGLRGGGFRQRKEGAKLLQKLGSHRVDALFLGHIHSYYAFSLAGVPAYISGGGGAIQERLDGTERHYLKVSARPGVRLESVAIVRVD